MWVRFHGWKQSSKIGFPVLRKEHSLWETFLCSYFRNRWPWQPVLWSAVFTIAQSWAMGKISSLSCKHSFSLLSSELGARNYSAPGEQCELSIHDHLWLPLPPQSLFPGRYRSFFSQYCCLYDSVFSCLSAGFQDLGGRQYDCLPQGHT